MFFVVGIGPGHRDYMLNRALETLSKCDYIIGFKRAVDSLSFLENKKIYINNLSELDKYIKKDSTYVEKNIAFAASGDPLFYGVSNYIKNKSEIEFEIIPGISSFQYLSAKIKMPWNNAVLGSLHGRESNFLKDVKDREVSIWLTDKINTPQKLCRLLVHNNIDCTVIIGENLSYDDECITIGKPEQFINKEFMALNVFIIKNN